MVAIFNIGERDGKLFKRDRPDAVAYLEEILVKVSDVEEKNVFMLTEKFPCSWSMIGLRFK
jgi:hypothetical protein